MDEPNRSIAKRQIARLLGSSSNPICVISEENTLVFANDAMGRLVGQSPDSLLGVNCSTRVPDDGDENAPLSAFFALPIHWSRRGLLLLPESGPYPNQKGSQADAGSSPASALWLRCLIPLEEELGCILCVFCPTDKGSMGEVVDRQASLTHKIMRENRKQFVHLDDLWFLQGQSVFARRALEQLQLAIANPLPVTVFGRQGSGRSKLAESIHSKRRGLESKDRPIAVGHSLVRLDCSLMDIELLQSMLEVIDESKINGRTIPAVLLEGLEGLPDECIFMLASFLKVHQDAVCIATYDPSVMESHSLTDPSWSEVLSRTSVLRIDLPKLIERIEDIPSLITAWFSVRKGMDGVANEISDSFVDALTAYTWPGDIEEFADALAHATQKAAGGKLTERDLPVNIRTCVSHVEQSQADESVDLDAILEDVEKTMIMRALERFPQNKSSAAKMLNISRARLLRRLQQWGIQSESGTAEGDNDLPVFNEVP